MSADRKNSVSDAVRDTISERRSIASGIEFFVGDSKPSTKPFLDDWYLIFEPSVFPPQH
jgi:hypothetical protein